MDEIIVTQFSCEVHIFIASLPLLPSERTPIDMLSPESTPYTSIVNFSAQHVALVENVTSSLVPISKFLCLCMKFDLAN